MRDARAGVTHTDARRDTDVDVAPHARAGVARERASRPGARDTPRPSSRCAVARPVLRRFHPPRAPRGCREPRITSSDRPFSPASLRRRSRARTPRVQRPHSPPATFLRRRRVERRGPLRPRRAGAASPRSEPRLSRDGGRALRGGQSRRHRGEPRGVPQGTRPRRSTRRVRAPPHPPARRRRGDERVVGGSRRRISRVDPRRRRRGRGRRRPRHRLLPHLHPTARTHV